MNGRIVATILAVLVILATVVAQLVDRGRNAAASGEHPPVFATHQSFESADEQAARTGRLLVADMMADWCGPCKEMDKTSWIDEDVASWINTHAVAVQVDIDENASLAREMGISAVPTIIVFDSESGNEVARHVGYLGPDDLYAFLEGVRVARDEAPAAPADNEGGG